MVVVAEAVISERGSAMAKRKLKAKRTGKAIWDPIPRATPKDEAPHKVKKPKALAKTSKASKASKAPAKKRRGKPGRVPMKKILVKVDRVELKLINGAIKKSGVPKGAWLKAALINAAQEEYGGQFSGKHEILPPSNAEVRVLVAAVLAPDDVPDATEHAVESPPATEQVNLAVHGAPTGGANFPTTAPAEALLRLSVPAPAPVPLAAPHPTPAQWQMGRVAQPAWQQPAPLTLPDEEDDDTSKNGQPTR
jgi:hypothetical protein